MDAGDYPARLTARSTGTDAPIRALFVLPSLEGGGAQRVTLNLLRLFDPALVKPILMLFQCEGELTDELPAGLALFPARAISGKPSVSGILRALILRARQADIIIAALQCRTTYLCWLAGAIARRPVIGWVQNSVVPGSPMARKSHRSLMRVLQPRLAASVFPCERAYRTVARHIPLDRARIEFIPNFIDRELVRHLAEASASGHTAREPSEAALIAVGRLAPQKGFDTLVRALHQLHLKGHRCRLTILGEGPERGNLTSLIAALGLRDSVEMPGFAANPYAMMRQADVFVLASRFEGLPLTLLEARALRMPIVATDCVAGPREILEEGRHGTLVPVDDPAAMASAIAEAIARPPTHFTHDQNADDDSEDSARPAVAAWERLIREVASEVSGRHAP